MTSPVPDVVAATGSRSPGRDARQPRRLRQLDDRAARRRPTSQRAVTGRPIGSVAPRRPPRPSRPAAAIATSVPSPPSASGASRSSSSGSGRAPSRRPAPRDLDRGQRALERIRGDEDRERLGHDDRSAPDRLELAARRRGAGSARPSARRRSRYSGIRIIGGRSWSASSMTSSDEPAAAGARQLHRRAQLGEQAGLAPLLEPLHHRLEDHERHPRQALELLVAVDPPLEVDLAEALDADPLGDVDEVPDLDRVAGEERDRLEQRAPAGVLAGERLDEPRQLRDRRG